MDSQTNKRPREDDAESTDEPTAKRPREELFDLPTFLVMDIIHMMPLEKIVEMYENGGQRIPVKTLARLMEKVLIFPTPDQNTNLSSVNKSFTVGKYRISYEEHGENCVDGTFSHSFTDYITSYHDGNHRLYTNRFRKSTKQRLNFAWLFGDVNEPEPEIERTVEEHTSTYTVQEPVSNPISGRYPISGVSGSRRSPFAMRT